jgi:hypothetical protein
MTGKLKIDMKRALKYSWIAANISLLQLGLGSYVLYPDRLYANNDAITAMMFLSFPSSIPTVVVIESAIQLNAPFDYLVICLVAFVSGYLQWFWCIPRMMQEREIIVLNLSRPEEIQPMTPTNPTRRPRSPQSNLPRPPFDRAGHSPLERAIGIRRG